jgi:ssDNA-binding replication factor A large subunit
MVVYKNLVPAKQSAHPDNKVVAMSSTSVTTQPLDHQRAMTRDERRIIELKLDEVHTGDGTNNNSGSYIEDWTDEKVAKHFNVPRSWVTKIREQWYGSNTNEHTSVLTDAAKLVADIKQEHAARIKCDETLWVRVAQIEAAIIKLKH